MVVKVVFHAGDTFLLPNNVMMAVTGTARLYPEWQSSLNQLDLCQIMGFSLVVWPVGKLMLVRIQSALLSTVKKGCKQQPATFNLILSI